MEREGSKAIFARWQKAIWHLMLCASYCSSGLRMQKTILAAGKDEKKV